jgi:hypothetical protein
MLGKKKVSFNLDSVPKQRAPAQSGQHWAGSAQHCPVAIQISADLCAA